MNNRAIGVTIFRMVIGVLLIKDFVTYLQSYDSLFGINGIFPYKFYVEILKDYEIDFLELPFKNSIINKISAIIGLVLSCMFFIGFQKRISGVLLIFLLLYYKFRNIYMLDGADNVISVVLLFVSFSKSNNIFFNNQIKDIVIDTRDWHELMTFAIRIQICYIYFFAAIHKIGETDWINGTALYYATSTEDFKWTGINNYFNTNLWYVKTFTYLTVVWELLFSLVLFDGRLKYIILFASIIFHIGIFILMRIDNYSILMISSYAVFLKDEEFNKLYEIIINKFSFQRLIIVK